MKINKAIHSENWLKTTLTKGSWYLLSSLLTKGISFFLIPIYTRALVPAEYGILQTINAITQLLPIFFSFYLDSAFGRYFHEYKGDKKKLGKLFSTIYIFVVGNGIFMLGLFFVSSPFWLKKVVDISIWPTAYLAFIPALFNQVALLGMVFLRQNLETKKTTFIELSSTVISAGISVWLLLGVHMDYHARLWGIFAGSGFYFVVYTWYFIKTGVLRFLFDKKILKMCLLYSIPLIPNIAGGWINGFSDRLIISKYIDYTATGIYSLAVNLSLLLYIVQDAATQVQGALSMSGLINDREATIRKIIDFSLGLWVFMLFANWALMLFSPEILFVMADESYFAAFALVPIVGFGFVLSSQYRIFTSILSYHKMTWVISSAGIISAILNLCLNIIFIPRFGYSAAAFTTVAATFTYTAWIIAWALKKEPFKFPYLKYILAFCIYVGLVLISLNFFKISNISINNFIKKLGFLIFVVIGSYVWMKKRKKRK